MKDKEEAKRKLSEAKQRLSTAKASLEQIQREIDKLEFEREQVFKIYRESIHEIDACYDIILGKRGE